MPGASEMQWRPLALWPAVRFRNTRPVRPSPQEVRSRCMLVARFFDVCPARTAVHEGDLSRMPNTNGLGTLAAFYAAGQPIKPLSWQPMAHFRGGIRRIWRQRRLRWQRRIWRRQLRRRWRGRQLVT